MRRGLIASFVGLVLAGFLASSALALGAFDGDGKFRVPQDVRPGTYRSLGGDGCYWARLKNFSGSLSSILANQNASGPTVVTIKSSDRGFDTVRCRGWTSNLHRITKSMTRFGEGTYIVRVDIAPGTYRSRGGDGCYWARLKSFDGTLFSIIANENASGSTIVTINRTDGGFTSTRCATWTKIS